MSDYIVEAIKNGVFETLKMTAYASLYAYIVGLPLGVILYATASGRLLASWQAVVAVSPFSDVIGSVSVVLFLFFFRDVGRDRAAHGGSNPDCGADGGGVALRSSTRNH